MNIMKPYVKRYDDRGLIVNPPPYIHPYKAEIAKDGTATGRILHLPNRHYRRSANSTRRMAAINKPTQAELKALRKKRKVRRRMRRCSQPTGRS